MAGRTKREIRDQDVQGHKCLRKIRPLLSRLRKVGTECDRAGNRRLFMDHSCALILMALFSPMIRSLEIAAELSWTPKAKGKHLSAYRLHTHFEVLGGKAVRIAATSAAPKGDADERAVLQRTIEADRCYILDRGSISERLWNAINVVGSSSVCRSSGRTLATVTHVNGLIGTRVSLLRG